MTIEEAGQVLLEGRVWVACLCSTANDNCKLCDGWRSTLHPDYEQACLLVGKRIPTYDDLPPELVPQAKLVMRAAQNKVQSILESQFIGRPLTKNSVAEIGAAIEGLIIKDLVIEGTNIIVEVKPDS